MIDVSPGNLMSEIKNAEKMRDGHIKLSDEMKRLYCPWSGGDGAKTLENHPFEFIKIAMPNLVFNNPKVEVGTTMQATESIIAESHEYALNNWVDTIDLADELEPVAYEFLFTYGVVHMSLRGQPGYFGNKKFIPQRPVPTYIRDQNFIIDPRAIHQSRARFQGHAMYLDREDLMADPRVNNDALGDVNADETSHIPENQKTPARKDVRVYELWVPEHQLKGNDLPKEWTGPDPVPRNGYHGTIFTLTEGSNNKTEQWLRPPRPCYCPPWGPYTVFGAFHKPGYPLPLSPMVIVRDQAIDSNDQAIVISESGRRYKRGVICQDESIAEKIKEFGHDTVMSIPGFDPQSALPVEIGGVTNQMIEQQILNRDRLDRNAGLSDALRGFSRKGVTATADTIAQESSSAQASWLEKRFLKGVSQVLKTASWYNHYTPEIVFGTGNGIFFGGTSVDDTLEVAAGMGEEILKIAQDAASAGLLIEPPEGSWYNLRMKIDMFSMRRPNESTVKQDAIDAFTMVTNAAPLITQTPHVRWNTMLSELGEAMNQKDLGRLIDLDMARELFKIQLAEGQTSGDKSQAAKARGQASLQAHNRSQQSRKRSSNLT